MGKVKRRRGQRKTIRKPDIEIIVNETSGLLEFLLKNLNKHSRNNVKSLLSHREVFVDEKVVTQFDYELKEGQKIRIAQPATKIEKQAEMLDIVFEDDDIIVINKPAGLLSMSTEKEKHMTAYHILTEYMQMKNTKSRVFIVHRLDRDTSGIIMFAKNEKMKMALQDKWAEIVATRAYVAVVEGVPEEKSGRIHTWLKETETLLMYSSRVDGDGLEAITNYKVLKSGTDYSLVDISLETGRKNQIRVHMKELGNSIAGDKKYGAKTNPLKRLALHAYKLEITHPFTDEMLTFETKVPKGFNGLIDK